MERANQRYVVILAVVATAILVVGSVLRPGPLPDRPSPPPPSQAELSRLAHLAQRRSLDRMTEYFATVASEVDRAVARLPMLDRSGVMWEPGLLVTTRLEPRAPDVTTIAEETADLGAALTGGGPHLPLAVFRVPSTGAFAPAARRSVAQLAAGAWTVFVFERERAGFTPATFLETSAVRCGDHHLREAVTSVALTRELAGAGLFDLDGALLAIVLACGERFAAVSLDDIEALVEEAGSVRSRIIQRYGMGLEALTADERASLGVSFGLLVRDVWSRSVADVAGLGPGDVIVAIDAEPIRAVDQLGPLVAVGPARTYDVAVTRGDAIIPIPLPSDPTMVSSHETVDGVTWNDPARGYRIDTVRPGSAAAAAGLRAGDRLLRIDGEAPVGFDQVRSALSATRDVPVWLEVERGPRRRAVLLP